MIFACYAVAMHGHFAERPLKQDSRQTRGFRAALVATRKTQITFPQGGLRAGKDSENIDLLVS
jgi:hypothetical protein